MAGFATYWRGIQGLCCVGWNIPPACGAADIVCLAVGHLIDTGEEV